MMAVMSAYDPSYRSASKPADNVAFEGCFPIYFGVGCAVHILYSAWHVIPISRTLVLSLSVSSKIAPAQVMF